MKKILGLDIGVSSVGFAIISETGDKKKIEHLGVRAVVEDPNFHGNFYQGRTASKKSERREKRGIRRNNQRFKQRRDNLKDILRENGLYPNEKLFQLTPLELYEIRSKSASEKVTLEELGRVFLHINKKRGFLSNRKGQSEEEQTTDYKKKIAELENALKEKTIGQTIYQELKAHDELLKETKDTEDNNTPNFIQTKSRVYTRASYKKEFDTIWETQQKYYPNILTGTPENPSKDSLYNTIANKTIFYQRPLKSQKSLISECPFEHTTYKNKDGETIKKGIKVAHKSNPYFEVFRIWQQINNLELKNFDGASIYAETEEIRNTLFECLFHGESGKFKLNAKYKLSGSEIKKIFGFSAKDKTISLNYTELNGAKSSIILRKTLENAGIENPEQYLFFNPEQQDEKGGLLELWHITYSLPSEQEIIKTLQSRFPFTEEQAKVITQGTSYKSEYGSLSVKAIRKLFPHLHSGKTYDKACDAVDYDHSGYKTEIELKEKLEPISEGSLRNPVVEQILNQVVNLVNQATEQHGRFDEIRVEMARSLKNNAKRRKKLEAQNKANKSENEKAASELEECGLKHISGNDIKRYKLWKETDKLCLYCNKPITQTELLNGTAEIEHIIPKSRSFTNVMSNFILAHRKCNLNKGQQTAFDFMDSKSSAQAESYKQKIHELYNEKKISKIKYNNLLCKGDDIPDDFVNRMLNDTQYIARETTKHLKTICPKVTTTTGQITSKLRKDWKIEHVLEELNVPKYEPLDLTEQKIIKGEDGSPKTIDKVKNWTKRSDHRHHAIDALVCALTDSKIILKLNNLNKIYQNEDGYADLSNINIETPPIENLREEVKKHLEGIFISFKKNKSKALSRSKNILKSRGKKQIQTTWTPRGLLHKETVLGQIKQPKLIKLSGTFDKLNEVVEPQIKNLLTTHLEKFNGDPKKAFNSKGLKELNYKGKPLTQVNIFEPVFTKKLTDLTTISAKQIDKIADKKVAEIVKTRLAKYNNKPKEAFKDLENNPLWLNQEKGISIKSITLIENGNYQPIRNALEKQNSGNPKDFITLGNNHHTLVYYNKNTETYKSVIIPLMDAVSIGQQLIAEHNNKLTSVINRKDDPEHGKFLFSMQINDLFVFDLNPEEIDFFNPQNRAEISKKLFRLQKLADNNHVFRHHLETTIEREDKVLRGITWERLRSDRDLKRLTKIKINHLGNLIKIGE